MWSQSQNAESGGGGVMFSIQGKKNNNLHNIMHQFRSSFLEFDSPWSVNLVFSVDYPLAEV